MPRADGGGGACNDSVRPHTSNIDGEEKKVPTSLYRAPYSSADNYAGAGSCVLCAAQVSHSFLSKGLDVIVTCPTCKAAHGFGVDFTTERTCGGCGASLHCPVQVEDACICLSCIESGRAAFRHSTEAGDVDWTGLDTPVSEEKRLPPSRMAPQSERAAQILEPRDKSSFALMGPGEGWVARGLSDEPIPDTAPNADEVERLRRTPVPLTWQDLTWPVCCNAFMIYLGEWSRTDFVAAAKGSEEEGRALFVSTVDASSADFWDYDVLCGGGALVFFCCLCGCKRTTLDYS